MTKIAQLEPKEVFSYFETICGIPHGSYHEKALSDYCVQFAKEHGLQVMQDELYNVIIKKDATKGYEQEEPLIIQGHLDMVCEKKKKRSSSILKHRDLGLKQMENSFLLLGPL